MRIGGGAPRTVPVLPAGMPAGDLYLSTRCQHCARLRRSLEEYGLTHRVRILWAEQTPAAQPLLYGLGARGVPALVLTVPTSGPALREGEGPILHALWQADGRV